MNSSYVINHDVFLSHAWADQRRGRLLSQPLTDALRARGLRVWHDVSEIQDFQSITRAVGEGLASSRVLVALYSRTYPTRRACQWELTAALVSAATTYGRAE